MLPVRAKAKAAAGVKPTDVKELLPIMILMVIIFLMLLFWENELGEDVMMSSIEHLHVDFPQTSVPARYCNHMVLQRAIRKPDYTCKQEHVFIHERPQKINSICSSAKEVACQNQSTIFCLQSKTKFKITVCELIGGTRYPACRYQILPPTEGFILITCDELGPVKFQGYTQ